MKIEEETEKLYQASLELAKEHKPAILRLALYENKMIYSFREPDNLTWSEHREVMHEVARRLDEYICWLADNELEDSQTNRSYYVAQYAQ